MNTKEICSGCQKPVEANAPDGLCPECLLKAGQGTDVILGPDSQSEGGCTSFVAPSLEDVASLFPQCEILGLIGQGGMGAVYKVRQKTLDRVVALKILPPGIGKEPAFAERFTREARALARLNHPGVVALYEFGQADGLLFFLMEFVDGMSLRHLLEVERISAREALAIVPQICDALQYAHDQGIVHRDIKPENILLDRQGRVKVADFGLAKLVETQGETLPGTATSSTSVPALTDAGRVMGTPQYMAPEQWQHPTEVDHRADIYSLGVVFYQMLTGELPGRRIEPPSQKVQIDVRLDEVVLRALEKEPQRRYQQVRQVKSDVETITRSRAGDSPGSPAATVRAATGGASDAVWLRRRAWGFLLASACFLVGALIAGQRALVKQETGGSVAILLLTLVATAGFAVAAYRHSRAVRFAAAAMVTLAGLGVAAALVAMLAAVLPRRESQQDPARTLARLPEDSASGPGVADAPPPSVPVLVAQPGEYAVTLSNGATLEVVAVTRNPRNTNLWWRPDGTVLAEPPADELRFSLALQASENAENEFVLLTRTTAPSGDNAVSTWPVYVPSPTRSPSLGVTFFKDKAYVSAAPLLWFAQPPETLTYRFGLAAGPWTPVASFDGVKTMEQPGEETVEFTPPQIEGKHTVLEFRHTVDRKQSSLRLVAEPTAGGAAEVGLWDDRSAKGMNAAKAVIHEVSPSQIKRYRVLKTPWLWGEISGIAMKPSANSVAPPIPASTAARRQKPAGFGPIVERVVNADGATENILIDFDSGRLLFPPSELNRKDRIALEAWVRKEGVDALADAGESVRGFIGFDMIARPVTARQWDTATGAAVADNQFLTLGRPGSPVYLTAKGQLPETFLIKTREGGMGVLQVVGFTDNPRGVRIRYKLVQGQTALTSATQSPAAKTGRDAYWSLGPVIERVIDFDTQRATAYLDLDTGEYCDLGTKAAIYGMTATPAGVDLKASAMESNSRMRLGVNLAVVPVESALWDATPDRIRSGLAGIQRQAEIRLDSGSRSNTLFFRTSEGGTGVMQWLPSKQGDDPSQVRLRYRLITRNSQPKVPAAPPAEPVFGPETERVVPFGAPCYAKYFQFRSGEVFEVGAGPGDTSDHAEEWRRIEDQGGVDVQSLGGKDRIQFAGEGCLFTRDDSPDWETHTADKTVQQLRRATWITGVIELKTKDLPATYLFKTGRGECGILQLLGVADDPRGYGKLGLKLRYKLIESQTMPTENDGQS